MHLATELDAGEQLTRAVAYGDGLFESMLFINGICPLIDLHLHRLTCSAEQLRMEFCATKARQALEAEVSRSTGNYLRVKAILCRHGTASGYRCGTESQFLVSTVSLTTIPTYQANLSIDPSPFELSFAKSTGGLKTLNRLDQVMAAQSIDTAFDERLCVDHRGHAAELIYHNLFVIVGESLYTHPLAATGVRGVMRAWVLNHLESSACDLNITDDMPPLNVWTAAFATNAINGIRAITSIGLDRQLSSDTIPLITKLQHDEREFRGIASNQ